MRYFPELENEETKISKKIAQNKIIKGWFLVFFIIILASFFSLFLLFIYKPDVALIYKNLILGILFVSLSIGLFITQILEQRKLSLKQSLIHNLNSLREIINKQETTQYLKELKRKSSILEFKYNSNKGKDYKFDIEKEIDLFIRYVLDYLKSYSKKDYLSLEDKNTLSMNLDIFLEKILNEDFTLEGLTKKHQKPRDFSQSIYKIKGFFNNKWVKIISLLIITFLLLSFLKLIDILETISFETYLLCATIIFMIYFGFFNQKTN